MKRLINWTPLPPVCKQNDKTKSVPGNFHLTLKLHNTQTPHPLHLSVSLSRPLLGGESKNKVTVQRAKRWDQDCVLDSQKHGEKKPRLVHGLREKTTLQLWEINLEGQERRVSNCGLRWDMHIWQGWSTMEDSETCSSGNLLGLRCRDQEKGASINITLPNDGRRTV